MPLLKDLENLAKSKGVIYRHNEIENYCNGDNDTGRLYEISCAERKLRSSKLLEKIDRQGNIILKGNTPIYGYRYKQDFADMINEMLKDMPSKKIIIKQGKLI